MKLDYRAKRCVLRQTFGKNGFRHVARFLLYDASIDSVKAETKYTTSTTAWARFANSNLQTSCYSFRV